jgi:hypothetical protein
MVECILIFWSHRHYNIGKIAKIMEYSGFVIEANEEENIFFHLYGFDVLL